MRLSISEQRQLDILIKELRVKLDAMKANSYVINPSVKIMLEILSDIILLLEQKMN